MISFLGRFWIFTNSSMKSNLEKIRIPISPVYTLRNALG